MKDDNDKIKESGAESSVAAGRDIGGKGSDRAKPTGRLRYQHGTVVQKSGDKTIKVEVVTVSRHPLYHKKLVRTKNYLAHDETNDAKVGDVVKIVEGRPRSKKKRWTLIKPK